MNFTLRRSTVLAGGTREESYGVRVPTGIPLIGVVGLTAFVLSGASIGYSILGTVCANEVIEWWTRKNRRTQYYQLAKTRARDTGRPLIVIGDPDAGTRGSVGYGDVCVDLTGCPLAPVGTTKVQADITKPNSIPAQDDSVVVVVFCTLELVSDIEAAWKEILRVAGSSWNVFVVALQPTTLCAWYYHGVKWVVFDAPPTSPTLRYEPVGSALAWINARKSSIGS